MRKMLLMLANTQERRLLRVKWLVNKFKSSRITWHTVLVFFSWIKFHPGLKSGLEKSQVVMSSILWAPSCPLLWWFYGWWVVKVTSRQPNSLNRILKAAGYTELLEPVENPWIDLVCDGMPYVFQQGSTPAHKAVVTQDWIAANLHNHITPNMWPSNLPHLDPLDFYNWSVVEQGTN